MSNIYNPALFVNQERKFLGFQKLLRQPGGTALVLLVLLTPCAISAGVALAKDRAACHAIALGIIATIYWGEFDLH